MTSTPPNQFPLIAGQNAGIRVRCTPQAKPVYDNLLRLSKSGNYWAQLIVNGIQGLKSGRLHVNNVFVKKETVTQGEFILVLPGCVATFEKMNTGEFKLIHMTADESYFSLQKKGQRPGLHFARKEVDTWSTKFVENGKITKETNTVVAVTDRRGNVPEVVADAAEPFVLGTPVSSDPLVIKKNEFHMHYTPGKVSIGGWRNLRQAMHADNDAGLHESAILLARAMYEARDTDNVRWIAEHGGSGVLIQAMKILATQGIKLEKHIVFFNHPTTLKTQIAPLAKQLRLKPLRNLSNSNPLSPSEMVGGLFYGTAGYYNAYKRLRHEEDYSKWKFIGDFAKETSKIKSASAPITTIAATVALGMTSGFGSVPALIAFSTAALSTAYKAGPPLVEVMFPRLYYKIKGKF